MAEYLKIPEVAQRLDVSEKTARRMVKGGKLPSVFIGGAYRISEEDLERYLEAAKVRPGDGSGKAQAPPPPEPSFEEVTGKTPEERAETSSALAKVIENLSNTYRDALEEPAEAPLEDIFTAYMQASLIHVGARTIAEDAGYMAESDNDSSAERAAKQAMQSALEHLDQVSDELEQAMMAAEAEQEFSEEELALIDEAAEEFEALPELEQRRQMREAWKVVDDIIARQERDDVNARRGRTA